MLNPRWSRSRRGHGQTIASAAVALLVVLSSPSRAECAVRWVTGYYASYSEFSASMPLSGVDYTALTHVIHWPVVHHAVGTFDPNEFDLTAAQSADLVAQAHAAGARAILEFGGVHSRSATAGRGDLAGHRAQFIASMVSLMQTRGYDGLDINWEELTLGDGPQFTAFIRSAGRPRPDHAATLLTVVPTSGSDAAVVAGVQQYRPDQHPDLRVSGPPGWVTWFNSPSSMAASPFPAPVVGPLRRRRGGSLHRGWHPVGNLAIGIQFDGAVWQGELRAHPQEAWQARRE